MPNITDTPDSENMFMEDRLLLQALKNKRILDQSVISLEEFQALEKKDLLAMILKSTILMSKAADYIGEQRSTVTRLQMDKLNSL